MKFSKLSSASEAMDEAVSRRTEGRENQQTAAPRMLPLSTYLLFAALGMGPGWIMLDILFVEVPAFQQCQPEGLRIAAHMSLAGAIALTTLVPFCLSLKFWFRLSDQLIVFVLILLEILIAVLAACFWSISVGAVSIAIHSSIFLASGIGSLQTVIVLPWLSENFSPEVISPLMTGSNFGSLLGAMVGLVQRPGANDQRFGPSLYFMLFAFVLTPSVCAFRYITTRGIERLPQRTQHQFAQPIQLDDLAIATDGIQQPGEAVAAAANGGTGTSAGGSSSGGSGSGSGSGGSARGAVGAVRTKRSGNGYPLQELLPACLMCFPPSHWRRALSLCALNSYLQLMCWGFLRATLPFASYHTASRESQLREGNGAGADVSMYAIELSYFAVTLGALASTLAPCLGWRWQMRALTLLFTVAMAVFFLACADVGVLPGLAWNDGESAGEEDEAASGWGWGGPTVVALVCLLRFLDGYMSPLIFRRIAQDFPNSGEVARWVALVEKATSFVSAWVAFGLVEGGAIEARRRLLPLR